MIYILLIISIHIQIYKYTNMAHINEITSLLKSSLNILRNDTAMLVGDDALEELSRFLILKLSEKHMINGNIKFLLSKYKKDKHFKKIKEYIKYTKISEFTKLLKNNSEIEHKLLVIYNFLWQKILSVHPKFKYIFDPSKKNIN